MNPIVLPVQDVVVWAQLLLCHMTREPAMNMTKSPTLKQLHALVAKCNDNAGDHLIWVQRDGPVHVSQLAEGETPVTFEYGHRWEICFHYGVLARGRGYVGPDVLITDRHLARVFGSMLREWESRKGTGKAELIDEY